MIVTREFEVPMDFGDLQVTAEIDISDDIIRVVSIGLEDNSVLLDIKEYVEEWMHGHHDFDTVTLRQEEREWHEAEQAAADREDRLIGEEEC
jgi:hypothetical protein